MGPAPRFKGRLALFDDPIKGIGDSSFFFFNEQNTGIYVAPAMSLGFH